MGAPEGYIDVASRIAEFRGKYPDGSLQPVPFADGKPFHMEVTDTGSFIVFCAAAYRTPEDPRPGIGTAWEPFPGKTNFTRNSELQNAETSAWGRAIVAVLAADTKQGIASAEEVRNRSEESADRAAVEASAAAAPKTKDRDWKSEVELLKALAVESGKAKEFAAALGSPNTLAQAAKAFREMSEEQRKALAFIATGEA